DPYLRSLPESERGSFPIYFLPPEKPTQIAYLTNGQIRVRRSDGSDIQLTSTVNENRDPSFSFNGEYLACAGNGIWVMKADGTDPVQVDEYFSARHPAFSPDGNWVIYVKNNDIYGRRIDRSVLPVRLTSTSSVLKSDLSFTPDGSRIIYTGSTSFGSQIFSLPVTVFETTIRVDGSPVNLTNTPGCDNFQPAVSRDGSTILFLSKRLGEPKIFAMNADGTNQRLLSFDPEPNNPGFPQFSPYGEARIMYLSGTAVWSADLSEFRAYQISPEINTDKKFAWGIYLPTRITVERQCCFNRVDPNIHFRYSLTINFNRFSPPASMIITEILPSPADGTASETWVLVDATFNDTPLSPLTSNGRTTGTLKWVISNNFPLGKPVSGTLKLTVRLAGDGPAAAIRCLNGGINDGSSYSATTGDAYLTLADPANPASCPLLPVDSDGDFFISDEELLSTIDLWVSLSQIKGWPAETSQWDYWLLKIIDFWVNPSGYAYDPALSLSADEPRWKKSP
ncbi:MAG TPA: hypothetical protein PK644_07760, partial [bacterium]|nr:hypothetical protein [bacterium]